jgi:hypothetical protein
MVFEVFIGNIRKKKYIQKVVDNTFTIYLRGCIPPLWGSGLFRSIQFSAFEATYTALDNSFGRTHIPLTNGIETRVIIGGIMSGTCRSFVETPLEYAKVRLSINIMLKMFIVKSD